MDSYQSGLLIAVFVTSLLMALSWGIDRLYLQEARKVDIGENARKVWGVLILAIGATLFIFFTLPSNIAWPTFIGLLIVVSVSGLLDLVLHWAFATVKLQGKVANLEKKNQQLGGQVADMAGVARGQE
ncbi:MAG: hypothetical protein FJ015_07110 [Chloroflexi bacterium]|nr:hypothetical protein [Chloroflexota bacterium]